MATAIEEAKSGSVLLYSESTQVSDGKRQVALDFYNPSRSEIAGPFESLIACQPDTQGCIEPGSDSVEIESLLAPGKTSSEVTNQGVKIKTTILPGGSARLVANLRNHQSKTRLIISQNRGENPPRLFIKAWSIQGLIIWYWFDIVLFSIFAIIALLVIFLLKSRHQRETAASGKFVAEVHVSLDPVVNAIAANERILGERLTQIEAHLTSSQRSE